MSVRHHLRSGLAVGAALALTSPTLAETRVPIPTSTNVLMPAPPAGPGAAARYNGAWQGSWQEGRTYRGDWSGSYDATSAVNPEARSAWLAECRQRLTAAGQIGDQGKFSEACEGWLAYFQAVGPNQPNPGYSIPVMLVPVVTRSDCVEVEVKRPTYHRVIRPRVLHDKRVRVLPD